MFAGSASNHGPQTKAAPKEYAITYKPGDIVLAKYWEDRQVSLIPLSQGHMMELLLRLEYI